MATTALVVEDEPVMADIIRKALEQIEYVVDTAADGAQGLGKADGGRYDLFVLDLMLPSVDGLTICRKLRERRCLAPILMLTARDAINDRVQGLETGADDYLPKPFHIAELQARAKALVRRHSLAQPRVLRVADLEIDTAARQVTRGGKELTLTAQEYALLAALAAHPGQVFTRRGIQERVWGGNDAASNLVDVYIRALRGKVDAGRKVKLIRTIYGEGYTLRVPSEEG